MGEIVSGVRRLSTAALQDRAARAASGLRSLGIGPGDLVALCLRNDFPFFEASLAAGIVGAYPTPVNWHYTPSEARYVFENSGAKAIIVHADLIEGVKSAFPPGVPVLVAATPPEIVGAYGLLKKSAIVPAGMLNWATWLEGFEPYMDTPKAPPGSIIYTSGTTGQPKGVRRAPPTAEQAEVYVRNTRMIFGLDAAAAGEIVSVVTGPMYHSAPNAYALTCARMGTRLYLQSRFDAEDLLRMIDEFRVTHLHMVPIMFHRLLKLPEDVKHKYDLSSLKFVVHAAAPCPAPTKRSMIEWWGPVINEYYGSTETSGVAFCNSKQWLSHPGTVGAIIPGAEVRIVDSEGRDLPRGSVGEIVAKWPTLADFTYHGDDAKRLDAEKGGLIAPGDVGYFDNDGYLYLCDRAKDMIISGGVNIYPAEIEAELHKMPGVADCAVFGVPDEEFGEAVYAVVQLLPGSRLSEADVKAYLRAHVAGYKVPKQVAFRADLPREDSGKIFKRKLREPFWANHERRI